MAGMQSGDRRGARLGLHMRRDLFFNVFLVLIAYLLPCAFAPDRLANPSPWIAIVLGLVLLFSQPRVDPNETIDRDAVDRHSALGIYAGMILPQVAAAWEFALRRGLPSTAMLIAGTLLAAAALAFRIWSIRTLGRFFTSTVRVQEDQIVVQDGPYRLLRHPSYTGALGTALGTAMVFGSRIGMLLVLVLAIPAYLHRMSVEERTLARELGEPYVQYMQRTWRLIPHVY